MITPRECLNNTDLSPSHLTVAVSAEASRFTEKFAPPVTPSTVSRTEPSLEP